MKIHFAFLAVLISGLLSGQSKYEKDFDEFWNIVNANYAYFDQQNIDWNSVREIYKPMAGEVTTDYDFIWFLEKVINEFHNGHSSLNTNLNISNRLIPTGQDMVVEKADNKYFITDLRSGFGAERSGLKIGNEVVLFNGKPVEGQLEQFLPKFTKVRSEKMHQYALDMLFAGTHDIKREITINDGRRHKTFYPDQDKIKLSNNLLEKKIINDATAYVKINNSLGNNNLIPEFDQAIDEYIEYENIIIDLTETPGGGNTTVARCILGRFINEPLPYQKHEFDEKEFETKRTWIEYVNPRKTQFKGKIYVLVGRWTGSMGEGIALGFDGIDNAEIIGTKMAGLLGAVDSFILSETKISFQIPTERLYHINGIPREDFRSEILTKNSYETFDYIKKYY